MKKVLFVLASAKPGGTAVSLFNLLSLLDKKSILADLFLLNHAGTLLERTKDLNLLPEDKIISSVLCNKADLRKKGPICFFYRIIYVVLHHIFGVNHINNLFYRLSARKLSNKYDVVIAYQEGMMCEYCRHIKSPRHVAWCHTNYIAFTGPRMNEKHYWKSVFDKYDHIACVSNVVRSSLIEHLGYPSDRISIIYNTFPIEYIKQMAGFKTDIPDSDFSALFFVSSGRYVAIKRMDRFVFAADALKRNGIRFVWYLLGDGEEMDKIKLMIEQYNLQENVIQIGAVANPFVYYKKADCFVMASETEGQPMVLNEALILGTPIITTNFPSAQEVVGHKDYGMIVPNTDEGIISGVLKFAEDDQLRLKMTQAAKEFVYPNEKLLKQIEEVIQA